MRFAVLGSSGMIGSRIVAEGAGRGHRVIGIARRRSTTPTVSTVSADAGDLEAMISIFATVDVVVAATRPAAGRERDAIAVTEVLLAAAVATGRRLLIIGGAAPLLVPGTGGRLTLDDPAHVPPAWREIAAASLDQLRVCEQHPGPDWTYISPAAQIAPDHPTGGYRTGTTDLLVDGSGRSFIGAEDFAAAVVDEVERPSGRRRLTFASGADPDDDPDP